MVASSVAVTVIPSGVSGSASAAADAVTAAFATWASTALSIAFVATDTPTAIDTPVFPESAAARDAAPTRAVISDLSDPATLTVFAVTPAPAPVPAPSWYAATVPVIRFSANAPDPATPTPVPPEAATATDPATVVESTVWSDVAVTA